MCVCVCSLFVDRQSENNIHCYSNVKEIFYPKFHAYTFHTMHNAVPWDGTPCVLVYVYLFCR